MNVYREVSSTFTEVLPTFIGVLPVILEGGDDEGGAAAEIHAWVFVCRKLNGWLCREQQDVYKAGKKECLLKCL